MQASESFRFLVGRLEHGEPLLDGLLAAAKAHGVRVARVSAQGLVDRASVAVFDPKARAYLPPRPVDGTLELMAQGSLGLEERVLVVHLHATLSRETDCGLQTLGGRLAMARAVAVEFTLTAFDDVAFERAADPATGVSLWRAQDAQSARTAPMVSSREVVRSASPSVETVTRAVESAPRGVDTRVPEVVTRAPEVTRLPEVTRAVEAPAREPERPAPAAVAASAEPMPNKPLRVEEEGGDAEITVGDQVQHEKFGLCEVLKTDGERIEVRPPTGAPRMLALGVFEVTQGTSTGSGRLWILRPKRR